MITNHSHLLSSSFYGTQFWVLFTLVLFSGSQKWYSRCPPASHLRLEFDGENFFFIPGCWAEAVLSSLLYEPLYMNADSRPVCLINASEGESFLVKGSNNLYITMHMTSFFSVIYWLEVIHTSHQCSKLEDLKSAWRLGGRDQSWEPPLRLFITMDIEFLDIRVLWFENTLFSLNVFVCLVRTLINKYPLNLAIIPEQRRLPHFSSRDFWIKEDC